MPNINLLLPDQNDALRSLDATLAALADFEAASRFLVARVEIILGVPVAVVEQSRDRWRVTAAAGDAPVAAALIDAARRVLPTLTDPAQQIAETTIDGTDWTAILLRHE